MDFMQNGIQIEEQKVADTSNYAQENMQTQCTVRMTPQNEYHSPTEAQERGAITRKRFKKQEPEQEDPEVFPAVRV